LTVRNAQETNTDFVCPPLQIPKSAEAISITLKYASEHDLDLAVKGGGHSTAGASSTDGGLLIDLNTHMRTTDVDVEGRTIKVGGGAVWGDVDEALAPHGLAAVGGTVSDTGVGGWLSTTSFLARSSWQMAVSSKPPQTRIKTFSGLCAAQDRTLVSALNSCSALTK
jgi:FAD/FMN-containing dehydrogenase